MDDGAAGDGRPHWVDLVFEAGGDPEVSASAAKGPEEVGLLLLAGPQDLAVSSDEFDSPQIIEREAVLAHQPAQPAAVKSRGGERRGKRRDDDPGRQGRERRAQANRRRSVEIAKTMSEPGAGTASGISSGDVLILPERRPARRRSAKLDQALVGNVRTWPAMPREKAQAAPTARPKSGSVQILSHFRFGLSGGRTGLRR